MKKLTFAAVVLMAGATIAFASSLGVPWFVDNAAERNDIPGVNPGVTGLIYLKSNVDTPLVCSILYFNQAGAELGPFPPNNTFAIAPKSALAFRPVQTDPDQTAQYPPWDSRAGTIPTLGGGQEGGQGVLVPNRPRSADATTPIPGTTVIDSKKNGSCQISWPGGPTDVQGFQAYFQTAKDAVGATVTMSYGHLLPPGF